MEKISAFMDGESGQTETQQAILRLKQTNEGLATWETFHLIGDTMRGDGVLRSDFSARFHARMEQEPTRLAPRVSWRKSLDIALSVAASVCAIAVVLMLTFTDNPLRQQSQIAATPTPGTVAQADTARARPLAVANQGKVIEYMMAHQEYSPSTALQGLAPYVRTVSETHDGNTR